MKKYTLGLIFTMIFASVLCSQACASQTEEPVGQVQMVSGKVFAVRQGNIFWLEKKDDLFLKDVLVSDVDSSIQVMFKDGSVFTMAEKSVMELAELVFDEDSEDGDTLGFKMATGVFRFLTGKIADGNPEKFQMKTPLGTLGIRGTEGGLSIDPYDLQAFLEALQSFVGAVNNNQGVKRSTIEALLQTRPKGLVIAHFQGSARKDMQFKDFKGKISQIALGKSLEVSGDSGSGEPQGITPEVRDRFEPARLNSKANTPRQYRTVFSGYNHNLGARLSRFCAAGNGSMSPNAVDQSAGAAAPSGAIVGGGIVGIGGP